MNILDTINEEYKPYINLEKKNYFPKFFKTKPGEYGEGDLFIGVTVPDQRKIAKKYTSTSLDTLILLLKSPYHEHRLTALLILVYKYQKSSPVEQGDIYNYYITNSKYVNNWDLVDTSCDKIMGHFLLHKDKSILYEYANSDNLWLKRISIITTFYFIKNNQFEDTLKIAKILLEDSHDLIHKAVGWMLREVGNRNLGTELQFLDAYCETMPRTMLRYAIEKFPEKLRLAYLNK